jgi:putative transcriptional regulator
MDSLRGQLLIAAPSLADPNFARTVVLVSEHTAEGAMGVVLNRPSEQTVAEAAPPVAATLDGDQPVYVGGPVSSSSIVFLLEFVDPALAALIVFGRIGFPAAHADMAELAELTDRGRVFAGYAGWGPGQLEEELRSGDWILEPAGPEDVFSDDAQSLWSAVLARKGGRFALLATMPLDPSLN